MPLSWDSEGGPVHLSDFSNHHAPYLPNIFESCVSHKLFNIGVVLPSEATTSTLEARFYQNVVF